MVRTPLLLVALILVAACGGGETSARDAGPDTKSGTTYLTGTFDETSGSPCITALVRGVAPYNPSENDPQCTVVEHPADGGAATTIASCVENGNQPPCWALVSNQPGCGGLTFTVTFSSAATTPTSATFTYQCVACPPGYIVSC